MPALDEFAAEKLAQLEQKGQKRTLKPSARAGSVYVSRGGRRLISFSCNDYLGLSHHPKVIEAGIAALRRYGAGAGASRLVTGNHRLYTELEAKLAAWKGAQAALVFGSGYLANLGIIPALMGKGDLILADKLVHACLLDGAQLSGASLKRFAHNDVAACRALLAQGRSAYRHCLLLTDHVFSMDGDHAPVAELSALAREFDAWLMIDDAHGLGEKPGDAVDIHMGTLSKALGGYGGYVCASAQVIEYLRSAARSLIYSTGLPPSVIASASAALEILMENPALTKKPLENARYFTSLMGLPEAQSPIVPLILGENEAALSLSRQLEEAGFLVTAIRPPTVPPGTARLRFAFSALHERGQIEALVACLSFWNKDRSAA